MNTFGMCFVLIGLLTGAHCKTVVEATTTRSIDEKLDKNVDGTLTKIVENTTDVQTDENIFGQLKDAIDDFFDPPNDVQGHEDGRTFGKRIQFMMMPMVYKMGVMMTMLVVLTVISLKGLAIGVMLLVLKVGAIFGKFYASTQFHGAGHGWAPPPQQQPVHVHLHNGGGGHHHGQAYGGWEQPSGPPQDEHYYYRG